MSRLALKKTLATLTPEQKDELILDLYSARKEAKEYLDFFINPDIDKLIETASGKIEREVYRKGKHGYNKPRITAIRKLIKDVASLNPGPEYVIKLMTGTIASLASAASAGFWYTDGYIKSFVRIISDALREADNAGMLQPTITELRGTVEAMPSSVFRRASRYMRQQLLDGIDSSLRALTDTSNK